MPSSTPNASTTKIRTTRTTNTSLLNLKAMEATWTIATDFTTRPIELLIDTGAQITLVNENVLCNNVILTQRFIQLTGFAGKTNATKTKGSYWGNIFTEDRAKWPVEIHVVDQQSAGPYDLYLANISFNDQTMTLCKPMKNETNTHANTNIHHSTHHQHLNSDASLDEEETEQYVHQLRNDSSGEVQTPNFISQTLDNLQISPTNPHQHPFRPSLNQTNQIDFAQTDVNQTNLIQSDPNELNSIENLITETLYMQHTQIPLNEQADIDRIIRHVRAQTFCDSDNQITRLQKIQKHGLNLTDEATAYIRYFGTKQFSVSQKTVSQIEQLKVRALPPNQSRTNLILASLQLAHTDQKEKTMVHAIVQKLQYQFFIEGDALAKTDLAIHEIQLKPDTGIINVEQFRLPQTTMPILKKLTYEMYQQCIISDSKSAYNAPTFLVKKKTTRALTPHTDKCMIIGN